MLAYLISNTLKIVNRTLSNGNSGCSTYIPTLPAFDHKTE